MVHIDIEVPRPISTLLLLGLVGWGIHYVATTGHLPFGGQQEDHATVLQAEATIHDAREEQQVLSKREEILRTQLSALQQGIDDDFTDEATLAKLRDARDELIALLSDKRAAEDQIRTSLQQIQQAQQIVAEASREHDDSKDPIFTWPVPPALGISAHFDDALYQQRFGMAHHAIDIPILQGSVVHAVADGTVVKVSDQGLGFNSLVIRHGGGFATLYGHVSSFLVSEGDRVKAGDPVALSGGTPGTAGAGRLTTGPHLHLQLMLDGSPVDPLDYLPSQKGVE